MVEIAYDAASCLVEVLAGIGSYGNNAYILSGPDRDRVTLVDVPEGIEAVLEAVGARTIEQIVVTHSHFDHWLGFEVLRAATDAPVYAGAQEADLDVTRGALPLADGDTLDVGGAPLLVLHTPGHTPGSICLRFGDASTGVVLTGDTLFPGGPGRTRDHAALMQEVDSIASRLLTLPTPTTVLPGHGAPTTIARAAEEYAAFAARDHDPDLRGDVLWASS